MCNMQTIVHCLHPKTDVEGKIFICEIQMAVGMHGTLINPISTVDRDVTKETTNAGHTHTS